MMDEQYRHLTRPVARSRRVQRQWTIRKRRILIPDRMAARPGNEGQEISHGRKSCNAPGQLASINFAT
jgi:hypothetical protein